MNSREQTDTDILIDNLALRDVPYFMDAGFLAQTPLLSDVEVLAGLASHESARVQMALIPLLLRDSELSNEVPKVVNHLPESEQMVLKLYYTATVLMQEALREDLTGLLGDILPLEDWYSEELGVVGKSTEEKLTSLAAAHTRFSGLDINWIGTYWHSANRFLRSLRRRQQGSFL